MPRENRPLQQIEKAHLLGTSYYAHTSPDRTLVGQLLYRRSLHGASVEKQKKRRPHPSNRGLLRSAQYSAMWETTPAWKRSLHLSPFAQEPSVGKAQSPFYKNRHENKTLNWAGLGRTALNTEQKQVGGMFIRKALVRSAMRAEDVLLDRARKVLEYYYPGPLNRTNENKFLPARLNHVARTRVISSSLRPSISPNERCVSVDSSVEAEE